MRIIVITLLFCISCSKQTNHSDLNIKSEVDTYNQKFLQYHRVNIDSAKIAVDSIFYFSSQHNYSFGIGIANLNYGLLENIKGNFVKSRKKYESALSIITHLKDDSLLAICYAALGVNYWQTGENDKALNFHFKALKLNEQLKLNNEIAVNLNHISMVYQSQDKLPEAISFAAQAMKLVSFSAPDKRHISVLHNMANISGMQANYTKALKLDSIGLIWCDILNVEYDKSMFYDNIANCNYFSGKLDQSIFFHLKAITIDSVFQNNKQLGDTYCNLGLNYEDKKEYKKAIEYYKKSIALCESSKYRNGVKNAMESLSALYFKLNEFDSAYKYLKESTVVKDSMINQSTENKIAELNTLYETEKKKQQIAEQNLKISRRNGLLVLFITIFFLSIAGFYISYNKYKIKQERIFQDELFKEEEKRSKAILESEENERQRLARELHDGVGQLLAATKLNLSTLGKMNSEEENKKLTNSLNILDDSIKEIRNISHNMVPDIILKNGLQNAINDFVMRINQSKKIKIDFECIACDESKLDDTAQLMLYRIIQESVTNTIKYAEAQQLLIQISADENELSLMISDDGKGFDITKAMGKNGIGLKNIQLRTDYLKGKLEIDSSAQNGTTLIIEIPLSY